MREEVGKKTMQHIQLNQRGRGRRPDDFSLYSENTEPVFPTVTAPLPANQLLLREPWWKRCLRGVGLFVAAVIHKINQLLALALLVALVLLATRFLLTLFAIKTSLFTQWMYWLSEPLILPFNNFLPTLSYDGYYIDGSTLVAIVAYTVVVLLVRQFFKLFLPRHMR